MCKKWFFLIFVIIFSSFVQNLAAADAKKGKIVFRRCVACHFANKPNNKIGPSLLNVIGRIAGSLEGYRYSEAMVKAGENGLVWNKENLANFLHNPRSMVKGTRMAAIRLNNETDIDDLIAYLQMTSAQTLLENK